MSLSTQSYKGARDFYPEDKARQKWMFDSIRKTYESCGYQEYDAPILEPTELYLSKGNQEIIEEQTYTFKDRGDRSVTIRTEMTPSVSRMVAAKRQELGYPLRWYAIPELWRYERMQRGRGRQFWQPNADIFGVSGIEAEFEIMMLARQVYLDFGASESSFSVLYSSRKLIDALLDEQAIAPEKRPAFARLIDKMKKITPEELEESMLVIVDKDEAKSSYLTQLFSASDLSQMSDDLKSSEAFEELERLKQMFSQAGASNVRFDMSIMRGFDYYTDIVFEVMDENPENNRAMGGGGRYDGLVGLFGVEPLPTVGYAMGDMGLELFLEANGLMKEASPGVDVRLILVDVDYSKTLDIQLLLRKQGLSVDVDSSGRKLDKCFKSAEKARVRSVIVVGESELSSGLYSIKSEDTKHSIDDLIKKIQQAK
jgi:histidyl-tRNA synthetase